MARRVGALRADLGLAKDEVAATALRFVLSHPALTCLIPGMRSVRNVERNAAVSDAGPLDAETLAILRRHRWVRNFCQGLANQVSPATPPAGGVPRRQVATWTHLAHRLTCALAARAELRSSSPAVPSPCRGHATTPSLSRSPTVAHGPLTSVRSTTGWRPARMVRVGHRPWA